MEREANHVLPSHGTVRIDAARGQAFVGNRALDLTGTEYRLLVQLVQDPGRVWSRQELVKVAIAGGAKVLLRTIDTHIRSLRAKLGDFDLIETVRGVGYRYRPQGSEAGKDLSS